MVFFWICADFFFFFWLKFVADGVFFAELNEVLTRELAEDGYSGVEVRVTPMRTEIIIRATRTQNVLGNHTIPILWVVNSDSWRSFECRSLDLVSVGSLFGKMCFFRVVSWQSEYFDLIYRCCHFKLVYWIYVQRFIIWLLVYEICSTNSSKLYMCWRIWLLINSGEKGRRIRELTSVVQKRFNFPDNSVELYAEKVNNRGLCAIAQAESLRYKLLGGLAVRRFVLVFFFAGCFSVIIDVFYCNCFSWFLYVIKSSLQQYR